MRSPASSTRPAVLHLVGNFNQGGSERQAIQLVRLLRESDRCEVHLACLDARGPLRGELAELGIVEVPDYPLSRLYDGRAMAQIGRFARRLRERKIQVVQTHDFYTNVFGMAAAALARVPVRIAARRETSGCRTAAQKWVELRAYGLAHAVVVNAEAVGRQLIHEGVRPQKVVPIYNGLDVRRVTPQAGRTREERLAALGLPSRRGAYVTLVANMRMAVKDHPMFLRAAQRVRAARADVSFVIAGEGDLTGSVRRLAVDLGLGEDVFFVGRCDAVAELLAVSDVGVLSSRAEGFSNAVLEYMAAGCPVVATDVGGNREAVSEGESGYLVPSGSDETMAERILTLLGDPALARRMGARGQEIVRDRFSCEAQLAATCALYQSLLHSKRRGRAPLGERRHPSGV